VTRSSPRPATAGRPGRLEMRRTRTLSIFEGMTARSIFNLTSGAFLAGYARLLGADDGTAGLLGAVPILAGMASLVSPIVLERLHRRKPLIVWFNFLGRLGLAFPVALPWIARTDGARLTWLVVSYLVANLLLMFLSPAASAWVVDFTPVRVRARYFARREAWVIGTATLASVALSVVLDWRKGAGDAASGFAILFATVLALSFVNSSFLVRMKEVPKEGPLHPPRLRDPLVLPFADPRYRRLLAVVLLWSFGYQTALPFTSVYLVSGLGLDYVVATAFAAGTALASVLAARMWGRMADRTSWIALMRWMVLLQAISCVFWFFTDRSTMAFTLPFAALATGGMISGMNISLLNLQYDYAPERNRTVYIGTLTAVNGVAGFAGALFGAAVLRAIGDGGIRWVFLLSAVLLVAAAGASALFFKKGTEAAP